MTPKPAAAAAAGAAAVLLLASAVPSPVAAADTIIPGKWEYTVTTDMPNLPQGVNLPPNLQMQRGAGGMSMTHTSCVSARDPTAELRRPRGAGGQCKLESLDRSGGRISWATTCTTPYATVQSAGSAQFAGESMAANLKTRTTPLQGSPIEMSSHVTGHYLGPCDAR